MAKLLHIVGSPRGERSKSRDVGETLVEAFVARDGNTAETLDVWSADLPPFDGDALTAKYAVMGGEDFTAEQQAAWDRVTAMTDHLKAFDVVVVSAPMWNFGIPYALKHYVDVVAQPGLTFSYDPEKGYSGLIENLKGVVIVSRSGEYEGDMASFDFQQPYLETWMGFLGIDRVATIDVSPTAAPPEVVEEAVTAANEEAASLGSSL